MYLLLQTGVPRENGTFTLTSECYIPQQVQDNVLHAVQQSSHVSTQRVCTP
jgi:hypothetical protein